MSLFLILLAAGESKRLKSTVPKPFLKVNGKSLLELSYESFDSVNKIKKTVYATIDVARAIPKCPKKCINK